MSVQDKMEHIFREIHLLFSNSEPYGSSKDKIVVEKQELFELLKQLNLTVYEVMDEYEVTSQKHQLAQRRSEMRGEEIVKKANLQADDIYAASIIYTNDALNRIQYIMDQANGSVQKIMRKMNTELDEEKSIVRQNQSELKEQLKDFADGKKYLSMIKEQGEQLKKEIKEETQQKKGKRIQNEGRSFAAVKPEIKINQAYFEHSAGNPAADRITEDDAAEDDATESLARITGKEFAEELRRRAGCINAPKIAEEPSKLKEDMLPGTMLEVKVDFDAEYFRQKNAENKKKREAAQYIEQKDRKFLFGKK